MADPPSASAPTPAVPRAGAERRNAVPAAPEPVATSPAAPPPPPAGAPSRSRLLANSAWTTGVMLASVLVTFFVSPIIVSALGDERYGVWAIVMSMTGYLGIADLGVRPAIGYFLARHDALGEREEVRRYANSAFVVWAAAGGLGLAATVVLLPWLPGWFGVAAGHAAECRWAMLITAGSLAITLPLNGFSAVVVAKQRFDLLCGTDLVVILAKAAATVVVVRSGGGLVGLALILLAADLVEMAAKTAIAFRLEPGLSIAPRTATFDRARRLFAYGAMAVLVNLAGVLIYRTDALVIGVVLSAAAVTPFDVGAKVPSSLRGLANAATRVLAPAASRLDARGDSAAIFSAVVRSTRALLFAGTAAVAYLAAVGGPFLARWQGARFRGDAALVQVLLALGVLPAVAGQPIEHVFFGSNRVRALAVASIAEGVLNLVVSVALAASLGVVGVALGTAIPCALVRGVAMPWYAARTFHGRLRTLALSAWLPPLVVGALTFAVLRLVVAPDADLSWPVLLALAAGAQAFFIAAYAALARLVPSARVRGTA